MSLSKIKKATLLAETASSPLSPFSGDSGSEFAAQERVASLLETFLIQARRRLHTIVTSVDHPVAAFLARYEWGIEQLKGLPIGLAADAVTVRRSLKQTGYSAQEIGASGLADDERLVGRVIGPVRDCDGRILSFWARDPLGRPPKFLFKGPWREQTPLVGLDGAFAAARLGQNHLDGLLVFERLFDALALQALGCAQAAAIVGPASDMTPARWERLAILGVRRVTLVPDDSASSRHNVLLAVENALRTRRAPTVWVLLPETHVDRSLRDRVSIPGRPVTAVELARARQFAGSQSMLETRVVHAYEFAALALLGRYRPSSGWSDPARHAAWKKAIEFYATSDPDKIPEMNLHFVPAVVAGLQRSWDAFQPLAGTIPDRAPAETVPPRPPISRPTATLCLPPEGESARWQTPQASLPSGPDASVPRRRSLRAGASGYCGIHDCGTTVCFCFD